MCLGLDDVIKIEKNEIKINFPYKSSRTNTFFSPELTNGKKFPLKIKKTSCIFSLASLISSCVKSDFELENKKEHLSSLEETKLYYALLRCLEEQPNNRYYLWI